MIQALSFFPITPFGRMGETLTEFITKGRQLKAVSVLARTATSALSLIALNWGARHGKRIMRRARKRTYDKELFECRLSR